MLERTRMIPYSMHYMSMKRFGKFSRLGFLCALGGVSIGTALFVMPDLFIFPEGRPGCDTPIRWKLGDIDPRFPLGRDAFLVSVIRSEAIWEKQLGKNLLMYDPDATFVVTTLFDERQKMTYDKQDLDENVARYDRVAVTIKDDYDDQRTAFEQDRNALKRRIYAFENNLSEYNAEVSNVNASGGATKETFDALEKDRKALQDEREAIDLESVRVGALADTVNAIAEKLNTETETVQRNLTDFRKKYGEPKPFIQGLYDPAGPSITIYQFENKDDLRLVLAHEFGHALGIEEHVQDDQSSLMYAMMGGQDLENPTLTPEDIAAYRAACAARPESKRDAIIRYLVSTPSHAFNPETLFLLLFR